MPRASCPSEISGNLGADIYRDELYTHQIEPSAVGGAVIAGLLAHIVAVKPIIPQNSIQRASSRLSRLFRVRVLNFAGLLSVRQRGKAVDAVLLLDCRQRR